MSNFLEEINRLSAEAGQEDLPGVQEEYQENVPDSNAISVGIQTVEHSMAIDKGYLKRRVIITAIICAAAIVTILGSLVLIRFFTMVKMEDFTGKDVAEIKTWCSANKLHFIEDKVFDMDTKADFVISQSVQSGLTIAPGSTVRAVVSRGADPEEQIMVPDLSAMKAPEIQRWVSENQLSNTSVKEEFSEEVTAGNVIRYEFSTVTVDREHFTRKDGLTVYVSKGPDVASGISMPSIVGKSLSECAQWVSSNGVKAVYVKVFSDTVIEGEIVSQSAKVKSTVHKGDEITFEISAGKGIAVPDFSKVPMADASEKYPALTVTVLKQYSKDTEYGGFLSQSVSAGTKLFEDNNAVTVCYSEGKPFIPNLIGMNESELPALFYDFAQKGANIVYSVKYVDSAEAKGTIVSASRFSEFVSLKENIFIEVSNGKLYIAGGSASDLQE